ncbi:PREDICTED: heat shock 70 kDa protein II-like [Rhagoletis zephyria]|uniref:heat shock 70 kDa protein II-like n=1 Tax=Rhagoletis zephyria TaxID=28612 RepID=UPI000811916B|nr:PREDICTED: heat shock 70 kDa protein II-like [Rhagoletis zephyria]
MTPLTVAFTDTELLIGKAAINQDKRTSVVYDVKRLIGRRFDDPDVQFMMKYWPFEVVNDGNGKPMIKVQFKGETKRFTPEEITSMVLGKLKETAEAYLGGTPVTDAVITVPARFNDVQKEATMDAAKLAGLNVLRIISEPVAAAIACGVNKKKSDKNTEKHVLVFHFGGETVDVSILKVLKNGVFEVQSTAGDAHLGGELLTYRLIKCFKEDFKRQHIHLKDSYAIKRALRRLQAACARAKHSLSFTTQTSIEVDALFEGVFFSAPFTRANFEELCANQLLVTLEPVEKALADAKLAKWQIDEVVLVGGSTRIPKVQTLLKEFFAGQVHLNKSIKPDEAVAYGASLLAAVLIGNAPSLKNICQTPDGVKTLPLSLGIEMFGGMMIPLINRGSVLPARATEYLIGRPCHQSRLLISVFEGERMLTIDNQHLGAFLLFGIPSKSSTTENDQLEQVQVTFEVDRSGLLRVKAHVVIEEKEKETKKVPITEFTLHNSCLLSRRLSPKEIEQAVIEAEKYHEMDKRHWERLLLMATFENSAHLVKQVLEEAEWRKGKKGGRDQRQALKKVTATLSWLENGAEYALKKEIERKRAKLVAVCKPVLAKLAQQES